MTCEKRRLQRLACKQLRQQKLHSCSSSCLKGLEMAKDSEKKREKKGKGAVDNTFRRQWDREEAEKKAAAREAEVYWAAS